MREGNREGREEGEQGGIMERERRGERWEGRRGEKREKGNVAECVTTKIFDLVHNCIPDQENSRERTC